MSLMDEGPTYINCAVSLHRSCFESLSDALFQQLFGILISESDDWLSTLNIFNVLPMVAMAVQNLPLVKFLAQEVLLSNKESQLETLREFVPDARPEDWTMGWALVCWFMYTSTFLDHHLRVSPPRK